MEMNSVIYQKPILFLLGLITFLVLMMIFRAQLMYSFRRKYGNLVWIIGVCTFLLVWIIVVMFFTK